MKLSGIFRLIRGVIRSKAEELPIKPARPPIIRNTSEASISTSIDTHKEDRLISDLDSQLADFSLISQVSKRNIDLNKISINTIGLSPAVSGSLQTANIRTVEQLSNSTKMDLLKLRFVGVTRLAEIQENLNSFLKSMLAETNDIAVTQLSFGLAEQRQPTDLKQQLYELTKRVCNIFEGQIPLTPGFLPSQVWRDLVETLGEEPKSFSELMHLVKELKLNDNNVINADGTVRYLALERATQWLKRTIEYECLDDEICYVVASLTERERLVLTNRYKIDHPSTLEVVGEQLGITRERVRQIQLKIQKKLVARIKRSTLLYSTAALHVLRALKDNAVLATWTRQLVDIGFLKDPKSLELLIAVAKATNSSELSLPAEFTQSLETHVPQRVLAATKPVLEKARKACRNCGAVRTLSLTDDQASEGDVEQILRLNGFEELHPGWWTRVTVECVPERVATKVVTYCGPVSPSSMRYALRRHLSRFQLPAPPSELLAKLLEQKGNFAVANRLIHLTKPAAARSRLSGPEGVFLDMVLSDGPIVSFEAVHHRLLEAGFSTGSVTSLLRYSPIVQKITVALYSLLGAKYDEIDIQEAQSQLTRIPANSTLRVRSDGVIEFETNAGTWLEYGGVLSSGPAASLKGDWRLINNGTESGQLVVDGYFMRGLSQVSKSLGVTPGDRIRIDFNTWTREAKMIKVVRNE